MMTTDFNHEDGATLMSFWQ